MRSATPRSPARALALSLALIGASIALLQFDRRGQGAGPVGQALGAVLTPIQSATVSAGESVRSVWLDYIALTEVRTENRALHDELRALQASAARTADLEAENARLRRLLELGDRRKDLRLRAVRVVARTTSPYFRVLKVTVDAGEPPVEAGMPVIAPGGVVGQIRSVSGRRAEVLLVTDPRSAIDVVLEQSRARGVAVGTGEPDRYAARLEYLQRSVRAVKGERVLTTGDDERYPRGLTVGEVVEVGEDESGPFQPATVRPLVDISALEEAYVVLGPTGLTADGEDFAPPEPAEPQEAP